MAGAYSSEERTLILTADKGLQQQALDDFKPCGLVQIQGKNNYDCPHGDDFTCQEGSISKCPNWNTKHCGYWTDLTIAKKAKMVVTNYSNHISLNRYTQGLGQFDRLILDEAHQAPNKLSDAIQINLTYPELHGVLQREGPERAYDVDEWREWAIKQSVYSELLQDQAQIDLDAAPSAWNVKKFNKAQQLHRKMATLTRVRPVDWVVDEGEYGYTFDAVNPALYAEKYLFVGIPHVEFYSGTLALKTLSMLNVRKDYQFIDHPAEFDPERFKIYLVPSMKVDRYSDTPESLGVWMMRIDQIIRARLDRKGIIHCGSFDRQRIILDNSEFAERMIFNRRGEPTAEAVRRFRESRPGTIFVSPSIPMGYDFIAEDCEYQIIAKVPFDDPRDKVIKARTAVDKEYGINQAVQRLLQMIGRGMRSKKDSCENFLVDEHFEWVIRQYRHLFPKMFWRYYSSVTALPKPLPKYKGVA